MTDNTANLRPYKPRAYPVLEGGTQQYISLELQQISQTLAQVIVALKAIDARLQAHGW
jgi:tRNA A37 N6-isopentenylltransferase MiaA